MATMKEALGTGGRVRAAGRGKNELIQDRLRRLGELPLDGWGTRAGPFAVEQTTIEISYKMQ